MRVEGVTRVTACDQVPEVLAGLDVRFRQPFTQSSDYNLFVASAGTETVGA
jgi:hypothetical protein